MRTKRSIINALISSVMSIVAILIGLLSQRIFIESLGVEYLGINGLFTSIVSMLGIVELGLGTAIIYHLYKPISDNDEPRIKSLMIFYKNGYRLIAGIVTLTGLLVVPFLTLIVGKATIPENIYIIYLLFLIDIVSSYLLTYKRSILYADQKNYIVNGVHTASILMLNSLQIAALFFTRNYFLYLMIKVFIRVIENAIITHIVNKRYRFLNNGEPLPIDGETKRDIFVKIKALFMHKLATFAVLGSDNIIISIFLGIKTVGLFNNYFLALTALQIIVEQAFSASTASIGGLLVANNHKKSFDVYSKLRFANFWVACTAAIGFLISADSLITIWLGNEYLLPFGVLLALSINLYFQLSRAVINNFKEAAGIFHEDRYVPIIESVVNVVFSIVLLRYFGLAGVFIGTICSCLLLHLYSYPRYVYIRLFDRSYSDYYIEFMKYLLVALATAALTFVVSRLVNINGDLLRLAVNLIVSVAIPNLIFYTIYRKSDEFIYFKRLTMKIAGQAIRSFARPTGIKRVNNICAPLFRWITTAIG